MTVSEISGYDIDLVAAEYFQNLGALSGDSIRSKIARIDYLISQIETADVVPIISLGSNCGPAAKLRAIGATVAGSHYFDNIVIDPEDVARIIRSELSNILCLKHLTVGEWEQHDSVYDMHHKAYYHHYFHLSRQKWETTNGLERRIISPSDVPFLLPIVRAQFEYLAEKFLRIARAHGHKTFIVRHVDGGPLTPDELAALYDAIAHVGGRQFKIIAIHSYGEPEPQAAPAHRYIAEGPERWGADDDWRDVISTSRQ